MPTPPPGNRLLAALPPAEFDRLAPHLADVTFALKEAAYPAGGPLDFVYFPTAGMMSAVVRMADGATAEVAVVGREGMLGVAACVGADWAAEEVYCQIAPCPCRRLPAAVFAAEVGRGGALRAAAHRHLRGALAASARLTACNALHPADGRLARWLLLCHDRAGADEFALTHQFLSMMLGVRRATVTVAAGPLQSAGVIAYRGGRVTVLDRGRLEAAACECYAVVRAALADPPP